MHKKNNYYTQQSIVLAFLLIFTSCGKEVNTQQKKTTKRIERQDTLVTFYLYGELAPYEYLNERDSLLTKPLGFRLQRAAYCEVSEKLVDSVNNHNRKMDALMVQRFGSDWKQTIEQSTQKKLYIP